jgi:phenylacetate-coenzyme A ligase PaaK-like adenylate-forming protein
MDLERLARVFSFAYENPYADFYRALYAARGFVPPAHFPKSAEEWALLPLLTKEDIAAAPLARRTFVAREDVLFYRTSSGTTNAGLVVTPRNFIPDRRDERERTQRFLEFLPHHFADRSAARAGIRQIGADVSDLAATARLCALHEIDGIGGPISPLTALIPHLDKVYDLAKVRYVRLWGERISPVKREVIFRAFPQALFLSDYSLSELHGAGAWSCMEMMRAGALFVHPRRDLVHWQLVDPHTGMPSPEEGEVVMTTLWENNAWPSLCYRTGDLARRITFNCSCGAEAYEILGRAQYDRAAAFGGLITSEELERALLLYRDVIEDDFELHIFDSADGERAELRIRPKAGVGLDAETVIANVAAALRISPTRTLSAVPRERLSCTLLPASAAPPRKQLRIFVH